MQTYLSRLEERQREKGACAVGLRPRVRELLRRKVLDESNLKVTTKIHSPLRTPWVPTQSRATCLMPD